MVDVKPAVLAETLGGVGWLYQCMEKKDKLTYKKPVHFFQL